MSENYQRPQSISERIKKLNKNGLKIINNNSSFNNRKHSDTLPMYREKKTFSKVTNRSLSDTQMANELKLTIDGTVGVNEILVKNNINKIEEDIIQTSRCIEVITTATTTATTTAATATTIFDGELANNNQTIEMRNSLEIKNLLNKKTSCTSSTGGESLIELNNKNNNNNNNINGNTNNNNKQENINDLNSVCVNNSYVNNEKNAQEIKQMLNDDVNCGKININKSVYDVGDVIKNINDVTHNENLKKKNSINCDNDVILSECEKNNKWEQRDKQLQQQQQQKCIHEKHPQQQQQHHHQQKQLNCDKNKNNLIKLINKNRATLLIDTLDLELNNIKQDNDNNNNNYHIDTFPINKEMTNKMLSTYDNVPESWIETLTDSSPCNIITDDDDDNVFASTNIIGGIGGKTFHQIKLTKSCEDLTKIHSMDNELPKKVKTTRMRLRQMRDSFGKVDRFRTKGKKLIKLFGGNLLTVEKEPNTNIPRFVVICITLMNEKNFLTTEGIYRISPKHKDVKDLMEQIERGNYKCLENITDPFLLAGVLKQFFISLEYLLFSYELFQKYFNDEMSSNSFSYNRMLDKIKKLINELKTDVERETLKYLIEHLKHVSSLSSENRMEAANLGTIWSPCLFSNTGCTHADMLNAVQYQMKVLDIMITNYEQIFITTTTTEIGTTNNNNLLNNENINKNNGDNNTDNNNLTHDDNDNIILSVNIIPSHVILPQTPQTTAFAPINASFSIDPGPEQLTPPILIARQAANIILPTATSSFNTETTTSLPNLNSPTPLSEQPNQNFNYQTDGTNPWNKARRNSLLITKKKKCCIL